MARSEAQALRHPDDARIRSESLTAAILFCDLRGFTPLAARLGPARVHELLTCYYVALSPVVIAHGGTVIQYTGDEIFAVFVATDERAEVADAALAAALEMRRTLPALNAELVTHGLPPLDLGIGLHLGEVVTADIGYGAVRQNTIIGDPVNVCRRFCSLAGTGEIALSDPFRQACRVEPVHMQRLSVELKGVEGLTLAHVIRAIEHGPHHQTRRQRGGAGRC